MSRCVVAVAVLLSLSSLRFCRAYLSGFPAEQCDEMDPTKIKVDETMRREAVLNASSEFGSEDQAPPGSLHQSDSLNLYRIVTSSPRYKRGRTLDITIRGPDFNAFMLQVRKIGADERRGFDAPARVGEFVSWPAALKPVHCDKSGQPTALTNKDFSAKSSITVKWKAPKEEVGEIHVVARFLAGNEYWHVTESREIPASEFPVNLKNCGKAKSCVLYSEGSPSCHEDNCDFILTYGVANATSVDFVLGGTSKGEHKYLAVGFTNTPQAEMMKLVACTRSKTSAEIKYFVHHNTDEGLMEHPMRLENKKMDLDGDRMWCSFSMPMTTHSDEEGASLDLSVPMYQVYLRGDTNYTKSANVPILPAKLLVSKKEIHLEKINLQYHTMEKPKKAGNDTPTFHQTSLPFCLLLLLFQLLMAKLP